MRGWLAAAALGAVLLGATGCGLRGASPEGTDPAAAIPVPLSVIRQGTEITLSGDVPDPAARRALLDAVITSADDVTVVDRLGVTPGAATPDLAASAPVFEAAAVIGDFALHAAGDSVTLAGTAAKPGEAAAVEAAARDAWPRVNIINELTIGAPGTR
ncbi:BON domain-containing protein [Mycobacterium sp. pW045]|uniref:channel-forming protein ArfA/OmpATb n=1 Tax=Mycobacterium sp. pW045 TaxID=3238984 RepID=UPI00351B9E74